MLTMKVRLDVESRMKLQRFCSQHRLPAWLCKRVFLFFFIFIAETMEKLLKREKEVSTLTCQVEALQSQLAGTCQTHIYLAI